MDSTLDAQTIQDLFQAHDQEFFSSYTLEVEDDYFRLPPRSNHENRLKSLDNVGMHEVRIDLLNQEIRDFLAGRDSIVKPLVYFDENIIKEETVDFSAARVLVIEGTYTNSLDNVNYRVFLDFTYHETKMNRSERGRDQIDDFTAKILEIEHKIIREHRKICNIVVNKDWSVSFN